MVPTFLLALDLKTQNSRAALSKSYSIRAKKNSQFVPEIEIFISLARPLRPSLVLTNDRSETTLEWIVIDYSITGIFFDQSFSF